MAGSGCPGPPALEPVRGAAAAVLGPLERLLGPRDDERVRRPRRAGARSPPASPPRSARSRPNSAVAGILEQPGPRRGAARPGPGRRGRRLAARPAPSGSRSTPGRATGSRSTAPSSRPRGSSAASSPSRRGPRTCSSLGSPDLTVGVRVGPRGVLGEASGAALAGGARPDPGLLSFALVDRGAATTGDAVTTLGSVGDRPFVAGHPGRHGGHRAPGRRPAGPHRHGRPGRRHDLARRRRRGAHRGARAPRPARPRRAPDERPGRRAAARAARCSSPCCSCVTLAARHVPVVPDLVLVLVVAWALLAWPGRGRGRRPRRRVAARPRAARLHPPRGAGPDVRRRRRPRRARAGRGTGHRAARRPRGARWRPSSSRGSGVLGALAVGAPVDLVAVAVQCLLTATVAALVVPLVVGRRARAGASEVRVRRPGTHGARPPCRHPPGPLPRRRAARRAGVRRRSSAGSGQVQLVGHDDFRAVASVARHPHARRARPARTHPRPRGLPCSPTTGPAPS